jgi:hypothetical protein
MTMVSPMSSEVRLEQWGWLPALTIVYALALLLVAAGYTAARGSHDIAPTLYWAGLLLIFVPTAARLCGVSATRQERIGLVIVAGLALYMVKVLHSPLDFTFHDEFLHWRTAKDIFLSNRLFIENPVLTVSPLYPGLEIITTAFAQLSGLSIVDAGLITVGVARVVFMLGLYLFFEIVGRSAQLGGMATLLYLGNSNFLIFDSQFSYESLSLPLATAVLAIILVKQRTPGFSLFRLMVVVSPILLTIAITHHLTGYALGGLLILWMLTSPLIGVRWRDSLTVGLIGALAIGIILLWTRYTGNVAQGYLGPVLGGGANEFVALILGENAGRQLFQGETGQVSPLWERLIGIVSVLAIVAVLPFGLWQILRTPFRNRTQSQGIEVFQANRLRAWQRNQGNAIALVLALFAMFYPVMLGLRLTTSGWEIANRSSGFIFWAVAFVVSLGILRLRTSRVSPRAWGLIFVIWSSVIFLGGTIAGWPPWARLTGPYLVSADSRSIEPQGIASAQWAGAYLDPQDRIAADRINTLLLASYGRLRPVTHQYDEIYISPVFLSNELGAYELNLIRQVDLRYAVVDDRLSTSLPTVGVYFEAGEPGSGQYTSPAWLPSLNKFDTMSEVSRIFDSGNIHIYDVEALNDAP